MNQYLLSILAGMIQGLTEFLPISSSGHLVIFHDFFGFNLADDLFFDVALHLATLFALILFFWKDILKLIKSFFQSLVSWNLKNDVSQRLSWYILIGTIPAVIIGYFLESEMELIFRNSLIVAVMLIAFGLLLYLADQFSQKIKDLKQLTFLGSIIIGVAQALALVPGVSRSGITIIAGLTQKLKREYAARYSFLLSMPVVFGAGIKKILDLHFLQFDQSQILILILGFISATLTGFFAIKYFLKFLQNHSFKFFAYYRIILGFVVLFSLYLLS